MKKNAQIKMMHYDKVMFFVFTISTLFLFQSCSEESSIESNTVSAAKQTSVIGSTSKNATTTTLATVSPQVKISGPDYIQAGTNIFSWNYTGNLPNADVNTIVWYYSKVNNNGEEPYGIGWGQTGIFSAVIDTYYSDPSTQTSYFDLYITIHDTSGNIYKSEPHRIMKKGKFALESAY